MPITGISSGITIRSEMVGLAPPPRLSFSPYGCGFARVIDDIAVGVGLLHVARLETAGTFVVDTAVVNVRVLREWGACSHISEREFP